MSILLEGGDYEELGSHVKGFKKVCGLRTASHIRNWKQWPI